VVALHRYHPQVVVMALLLPMVFHLVLPSGTLWARLK
jgi:hypothetical protein